MKTRHFVFVVLTLPLALTASAQENPRVAYQNELLARALSPQDKKLCDERVGERNEASSTLYDQCHVTRLFVSDLQLKKPVAGAPPMLKGQFLNKSEIALVADAIKPR